MLTDFDMDLTVKRHAQELHEQADQARLAREYRRHHPRTPIRAVIARWLRTVADRLAPPEPARPPTDKLRWHRSGATPSSG